MENFCETCKCVFESEMELRSVLCVLEYELCDESHNLKELNAGIDECLELRETCQTCRPRSKWISHDIAWRIDQLKFGNTDDYNDDSWDAQDSSSSKPTTYDAASLMAEFKHSQ